MDLRPANVSELTALIKGAHARAEKISSFDLTALNRLLEHKAEDMTATVEAGMVLADLQKQLAARGQWLPIDPPHPEKLTIGELLGGNPSGPRRFGCGTVRDYVIGLQAVLADGRLIHSGGKVVKNVAGYDLMKLYIGSRGTLGIIVQVTFKVLPLPESEKFVEAGCDSLETAEKLIETILDSSLTPNVLDLHNLAAASKSPFTLVAGFAGTIQEVEWQLAEAGKSGVNTPSSLAHEKTFFDEPAVFQKLSILPSKLISALDKLKSAPFVARAGNGIIYHRGLNSSGPRYQPTKLEQRLKSEFDPRQILPAFDK